MSKTYRVQEVFYSPQGEGHRAGLIHVFCRFSFCNLQCVDAAKLNRPLTGVEVDAGFNCDTFFSKPQHELQAEELVDLIKQIDEGKSKRIIFTGGEPALQLDTHLCRLLKKEGYFLCVETNGTRPLPLFFETPGVGSSITALDWVSCSPKPGTKVVLKRVDEVRCVIKPGQEPDTRGIEADHYFVSPACRAPEASEVANWHASARDLTVEAVQWAIQWCAKNPRWRLSTQAHKVWGVR